MDEWELLLKEEKKKPYFLELQKFLKEERAQSTVFPAEEEVFFALEKTPFSKVKVVLLGQDPYHGLGQAHGLAFSVKKE
ncbi:MAG: uracil-DNA glycosylase, partial [Chlamydiae bacterium]|nr:uracil-DNA glycosylase [Chlamydiota bacterium]